MHRTLPLHSLPILCVLISLMQAFAADVGDSVTFERAGQKFSGKVVSVRPGGKFVEVEFQADGQSRKLIVAASSVTVVSAGTSSAMRSWSDLTGRFRIEAVLQSQTALEVVLRKADGTLIKVPVDKLSATDQEYLASLEAQPSANPFEAGIIGTAPASMGAAASNSSTTVTSGLMLSEPAIFAKATNLIIQSASPPTGFEPDPSTLDFSAIKTAAMAIPKPEGKLTVGRPLFITPSGTDLCYQARTPRAFGRDQVEETTQIFLIDGAKRKTQMVGELKGYSVWLCSGNAVTGDVLGAVMKHGDDKGRSLCVISGIANSQPRVIAHWRMYPNDENAADYVRYRKILPNKVVVVFYNNTVHAFDYENQQEVWSVPSQAFNEPAISPGGRYAACMIERGCAIIETKTGQQLGSLPVDLAGAVSLGFSQDGTRLAIAGGTQVRVYDVASAKEVYSHEANVALGAMGKQVFWLDDQHLLLPTGLLLDTQRDVLLWNYQLADDGIDYTDTEAQGLLAFAGNDRMTIIRLPHEPALRAADGNLQGIVAVNGGDSMAISLQAPDLPQGELNTALSNAITKAGYQPSRSAQTQLVASLKREAPKTEEYRIIGRGFSHEEVTFTPITSRIEIKQNGQVLWQRSTTSSLPFMLSGNKTLQDAARDAEKPNLAFFNNIALPKQILKPEYQNGFGASTVSAAGIVDKRQ